MDRIELMLHAYKCRNYADFSKHLKLFRLFSRRSTIRLPFFNVDKSAIASVRMKIKIELQYTYPNPYIILTQFQHYSTLRKCKKYMGPTSQEYIDACLERECLLDLVSWSGYLEK